MRSIEIAKRRKQELDSQLDLELQGTFPASDPPTVTQYRSDNTPKRPEKADRKQ